MRAEDFDIKKMKGETKEAPKGTYFTKSGNLVKGKLTKDAKTKGARQTDPKDEIRKKVPKVTQYNEEEHKDFEIKNLDKLDRILFNLCKLVVDGQRIAPDFFGIVASAILTHDHEGKDRLVMGINGPDSEGRRIHGERAAIYNYEQEYGNLPEGSILITTLSPCNNPVMPERSGGSCTNMINEYPQIRKVYCGYHDPSQGKKGHDQRLFSLQETNNIQIRELCLAFKNTFIPENFADGKKPGRKGLSKRVGIPKNATLAQLEKIAKSSTGERRRMAQWQLNMRRGRRK
tara:strand:- start:65 stop:928 length:864 start_codon:yes stop_codon:yes gene_type:complete